MLGLGRWRRSDPPVTVAEVVDPEPRLDRVSVDITLYFDHEDQDEALRIANLVAGKALELGDEAPILDVYVPDETDWYIKVEHADGGFSIE